MKLKTILATALIFLSTSSSKAQINERKLGAWYIYFFDATIKKSDFGVHAELQYRNWNVVGDLEQLLTRTGVTYKPKKADILFTLGYGNIVTGTYGSDQSKTMENRIYQEALFPVKLATRIYTNHRFRYEQRFVENQDFRTRYRYNLFVNIPLNNKTLEAKTVYLGLYNEIFINGQRDIGNGNTVEIFDRNRLYFSLGYVIKKEFRIQLGWMRQTTDNWSKNQMQLSFHHKI